VELVFNTRTSRGRVTKNARITSNDQAKPTLSIDFTAQIMPEPDTVSPLRFSPERLEFDKKNRKLSVTVENYDSTEAKLDMVGLPAGDINAKIKDEVVRAGKTGKLEFQWKGDTLPEYDEDHVFTFETSSKSVHRFSVPYVIRGQKGSKSGTPVKKPMTREVPPTSSKPPGKIQNTAGQSDKSTKPTAGRTGEIYKPYSPDSVDVDKPLPGAQHWPPR
jgi:hypothetical protein